MRMARISNAIDAKLTNFGRDTVSLVRERILRTKTSIDQKDLDAALMYAKLKAANALEDFLSARIETGR